MLNGINKPNIVDIGCNLTAMPQSMISMLNIKILKVSHIKITIAYGSMYVQTCGHG